jgi:bifunctional DNA-binding transcriptional regulator/antitoxin component of YhaV-PrlF toxin-antitoxin module
MRRFKSSEINHRLMIQDKIDVGKNGKILPKKSLMVYAGIKPGDKVLVEAFEGELLIKKIYSLEEALSIPTIVKETPENIEKDINKENQLQKKLTNEEH